MNTATQTTQAFASIIRRHEERPAVRACREFNEEHRAAVREALASMEAGADTLEVSRHLNARVRAAQETMFAAVRATKKTDTPTAPMKYFAVYRASIADPRQYRYTVEQGATHRDIASVAGESSGTVGPFDTCEQTTAVRDRWERGESPFGFVPEATQ